RGTQLFNKSRCLSITLAIFTRYEHTVQTNEIAARIYIVHMTDHGEWPQITDAKLTGILEDLKRREPIFHRPELGTRRADFENMIVADFWEVGASGRQYSREFVLNELERRYSVSFQDEWRTTDFHCRQLCEDMFLLTYRLFQGERKTRRSTIWQRTPD